MQLRRRGRTLSGLCPFHNEKTPSFVVYPDTQSFYCFGCGAAGDVINFVRKYNNLGYVESVKQLAARAGMPLPEEDDRESRARQRLLEINRCAARYFYENLNAQTPEAVLTARADYILPNTSTREALAKAANELCDALIGEGCCA